MAKTKNFLNRENQFRLAELMRNKIETGIAFANYEAAAKELGAELGHISLTKRNIESLCRDAGIDRSRLIASCIGPRNTSGKDRTILNEINEALNEIARRLDGIESKLEQRPAVLPISRAAPNSINMMLPIEALRKSDIIETEHN